MEIDKLKKNLFFLVLFILYIVYDRVINRKKKTFLVLYMLNSYMFINRYFNLDIIVKKNYILLNMFSLRQNMHGFTFTYG